MLKLGPSAGSVARVMVSRVRSGLVSLLLWCAFVAAFAALFSAMIFFVAALFAATLAGLAGVVGGVATHPVSGGDEEEN